MSCYPGTPCYNSNNTIFPRGCGIDPCHAHKTNTDLTFYSGPNLPCTGINTCDDVTLSLEKIDSVICDLIHAGITTTTTTTTTIAPNCGTYTVFNPNPINAAHLPYSYTNCDLVVITGYILPQEILPFCVHNGLITAIGCVITHVSDACFTPATTTTTTTTFFCNPCVTYLLINLTAQSQLYTYGDCTGTTHNDIVLYGNDLVQICVCMGSILYDPIKIQATVIAPGCHPLGNTTTTTTTIPIL